MDFYIQRKIGTWGQAEKYSEKVRSTGQKCVFTNGCFDLLHPGHVQFLFSAREMGAFLIVGVNSDESVRKIKGERRPIQPLKHRCYMLAALACVDLVVPFEQETPEELLQVVRPSILVKGGDYADKHWTEIAGILYCEDFRLVKYNPHHSTTKIINRILELNYE